MSANVMKTIRQIAEELNIDRSIVRLLFNKGEINPSGFRGTSPVFDEMSVDRVREILEEVNEIKLQRIYFIGNLSEGSNKNKLYQKTSRDIEQSINIRKLEDILYGN